MGNNSRSVFWINNVQKSAIESISRKGMEEMRRIVDRNWLLKKLRLGYAENERIGKIEIQYVR